MTCDVSTTPEQCVERAERMVRDAKRARRRYGSHERKRQAVLETLREHDNTPEPAGKDGDGWRRRRGDIVAALWAEEKAMNGCGADMLDMVRQAADVAKSACAEAETHIQKHSAGADAVAQAVAKQKWNDGRLDRERAEYLYTAMHMLQAAPELDDVIRWVEAAGWTAKAAKRAAGICVQAGREQRKA